MSYAAVNSMVTRTATGLAAALVLLAACDDAQGPAEPGPAPVPVAHVEVAPAGGALPGLIVVGDTLRLAATARSAAGEPIPGRPVAWTTTAADILDVDGGGLLTARGVGTATITARIDGREGARSYTVSAVPDDTAVAEVRVAPTALIIAIGGTRALTARAYDRRGVEIHGRPVTWSSNAAGVAAVDQQGVVTAIAPGYAEIHAVIDGRTGAATVTVPTPEPVRYVFVNPSVSSIWTDGVKQLTVSLAGATGGEITGRAVTWHSENPGIATVDGTGRVRGISRGTARIVATSEGVSAVATVNVWQHPSGPVHVYRLNGVAGARGVPRYIGSGEWVDGSGVTHRVARFAERGTLTLDFATGRYHQVVEVDLYANQPWRRVATITLRDEGTLFHDFGGGGYWLRSEDAARPLLRAAPTDVAELTLNQDFAGSGTVPWLWVLAQD